LKDMQAEEEFTTGDSRLDKSLGGGIRTGMIWEVVGERSVPCSGNRRATKTREVLRVRPKWRFSSPCSCNSQEKIEG